MNYPSPLPEKATIGLVAPCSPVIKSRFLSCVNTITGMGHSVVVGNSCLQSLHGYLAGDDTTRANDINELFADPTVDAIFCLRGGYGSTRIMELLDYDLIRRNPKIFVGYSDVTSFHLAFQSLCNLVTFHGPMVSSNMVDDFDSYTRASFFKAISMPSSYSFSNPPYYQISALSSGTATGTLIGGCLSLISPAIGTFYQPDFHGKILFLEDIGESLPRCDKLMQHLKNAGVFEQVKGVLIGNFIDCDNPLDSSYSIHDFFTDFFAGYDKPVLYGIQSGHDKPMETLPFGMLCSMDAESKVVEFMYHR